MRDRDGGTGIRAALRRRLESLKVLLDECVSPRVGPSRIGLLPSGSVCDHVRRIGFAGVSNGELHAKAVDARYDAFVTTDMSDHLEVPKCMPDG